MDNLRLGSRSEHFNDDRGQLVEKRCFFLCCGEDEETSDFLNLRVTLNLFDEPRNPNRVELTLKLSQTLVEISKEVVASGSLLLPEFTAFFRYTDLYACKIDLNRTLELYTPIFTLKDQMISSKIPEYYI